MGYVEDLRKRVGNHPLILVRPSVAIMNEECIRREVNEEIHLDLGARQLFGVFSGKELYAKLRNGHEYYNVVIGYICSEYEGEVIPDGEEVLEARFFDLSEVPDRTQPFIKEKKTNWASIGAPYESATLKKLPASNQVKRCVSMKRKVFFYISVLGLITLFGCSLAGHQQMNEIERNAASLDHPKKLQPKESFFSDTENAEIQDSIAGEAEDENLKVIVEGTLNDEKSGYITNVSFQNKTNTPIDLIYDCGLLLTSTEAEGSDRNCVSVESMLLKRKSKEEMEITLNTGLVNNEAEVFVRYRKDKQMNKVYIQFSN